VAVFDEMRKGLQEIESIKTPDAGELRIGSSIVTDAGLLPAVIERFTKDFPRVALHVLHENIAVQQYENLRERKAELVLGRRNEKSEPDLIAEPLYDEPLVAAAGTESRWAKRRNMKLADLIDEPWIFASSGSLARSLADEVFRRSGLETPSAKIWTVSLHLYLRLMETGDWLGLIPASTMRFGGKHRRIKALPIDTSCPPAPVGIVTFKDRTLTPLAQRFIEYTRKIASEASK
jgi:DNA-binding transcriptional LysR family regulator